MNNISVEIIISEKYKIINILKILFSENTEMANSVEMKIFIYFKKSSKINLQI